MAKLNEDVKVVMLKGEKGEKGEAGIGIPTGGKTGQAIIKASDNDYDYKWGSLVVNDVANATNDGNGNNIVNTYATKAELNTAKTEASDTYLSKTDASNIYVPRTDNAINTIDYFTANGTDKWFKLATLKVTMAYCNDSIQFEIAVRDHEISTLLIVFNSAPTVDPTLQSFITDNYNGFYLKKTATSTWELYCTTATWSRITIKSIYNGTVSTNANGVTITPDITPVSFIPSDAIQAVNPNLTKGEASNTYATKAELANVANKIYPVGSIYMSVNGTNPSTLFGGTWELLKDRFLLGAGGAYGVGSTGGEAQHTLTIQEMPSHFHHFTLGIDDGSGGFRGAVGDYKNGASSSTTEYEGGGIPHNNMPPYLAVYMWKRTA